MSQKNYQELFQEVEKNLRVMESDQVSIDQLSEKLKETYSLIDNLMQKLTGIETQVKEIVAVREKNLETSESNS